MSGRSNMTSSMRSESGSLRANSLHEKLHATTSSEREEKVMLAAEESKDRLYEPKRDKKMVRVLTVVVYVFSVSLAAIMLSLYYVFFWEPKGPHYVKPKVSPTNLTAAALAPLTTLTPPPRCSPPSVPGDLAVSETTSDPAPTLTDDVYNNTDTPPSPYSPIHADLLENQTNFISKNTSKRKRGRDPS